MGVDLVFVKQIFVFPNKKCQNLLAGCARRIKSISPKLFLDLFCREGGPQNILFLSGVSKTFCFGGGSPKVFTAKSFGDHPLQNRGDTKESPSSKGVVSISNLTLAVRNVS